jgi:hypothetical protein
MRTVMRGFARVIAIAATAGLFASYVAVGHGLHAPNDGMKSMHGNGICLVLFTLALGLAVAVVRRRADPPTPVQQLLRRLLPVVLAPAPTVPTMPARASPAQLQVFRR